MAAPAGAAVHRSAHEAMATVFEVFIAGRDETYARQAARAVFSEVDRLERLFSRFDPSSEISRLGRLGPGESLRIGVETAECLTAAAGIEADTEGAFAVDFRNEHAPRRSLSGLLRLVRTAEGFEAERLRPDPDFPASLDLDLGGIAKGYALDKALAVLNEWGVANALLHAGTSTALAIGDGPEGDREAAGWAVGVASGWKARGAPGAVRLRNRALSGSGTEVKGSHVIDPRTGDRAAGHLAAWASHPSATVADALSTAFMVMGPKEVRAFCASRPEIWALVIPGPKTCRILNADALAR